MSRVGVAGVSQISSCLSFMTSVVKLFVISH